MKIFDREYYRLLRASHGYFVSITLATNPIVIIIIGGFVGALVGGSL